MATTPRRRRSGGRKSEYLHPINILVGSRIRSRRKVLGLTQKTLGVAVGVSLQQVHKYERGRDRIAAGRLHQLAEVLDVPVSFFFDAADAQSPPATPAAAEPPDEWVQLLSRRESTELIDAYFAIRDAAVQQRLVALGKALAADRATGTTAAGAAPRPPAGCLGSTSKFTGERSH